ncbi:MAG TPA: acylneuraminate cytidylyltransferase family protein [Chryseolinea sp.]
MKRLFFIPARGGSKGIPGKNIKPLRGKPLIGYTLEAAMPYKNEATLCVSTDSLEIKKVVESYGISVPFLRPDALATDTATTESVILHALEYYRQQNIVFDTVILLQPTSPLRNHQHIEEALALFETGLDMVVSVKESKANPYYNLFEENEKGFLEKSKPASFTRRQDAPKIYEYNGAIYAIRVESLVTKGMAGFNSIRKYVMDDKSSIDLDDAFDWYLCETILNNEANF